MEKLKIYVVSLMAMCPARVEGLDEGSVVEQRPALVPAISRKAAADQARANAHTYWPVHDGWYGHQAAVMAVTKDFYDAVFKAKDNNVLDMSEEDVPGETFTLE